MGAPADGRPRTAGRRPGRGLPRLRRRPARPLVHQRAAQGGAGLVRRPVRAADVRARHRRDGRLGGAAARRPARSPGRRLRRADRRAAPRGWSPTAAGSSSATAPPGCWSRAAARHRRRDGRPDDGSRAGAVVAACHMLAHPGAGRRRTPPRPWPTPTRRSATASASSSGRSPTRCPSYPGRAGRAVGAAGCSCCAPTAPSSPPRTATGRPAGCPANPVPLAMCFSASDDTLAPPGQHVVTIWGQWYPYALADGADWDDLAETEAAPARRRRRPVRARASPTRYSGCTYRRRCSWSGNCRCPRGNVMHVEMGLASMFGFRPTPGALRATPCPAWPGSTSPAPPPTPAAGCRATPGGRRPACCSPTGGRCVRGRAAAAPRWHGDVRDGGCPRPRWPPAAAQLRPAAAGAGRCCSSCTAIAYPLTAGAARDAVSWTIVVAGRRRCRSCHAALSRGRAPGRRRPRCLVAVAAVAVRGRRAWPPASLRRYSYSDALGPDRCSACRSSCRWPG